MIIAAIFILSIACLFGVFTRNEAPSNEVPAPVTPDTRRRDKKLSIIIQIIFAYLLYRLLKKG